MMNFQAGTNFPNFGNFFPLAMQQQALLQPTPRMQQSCLLQPPFAHFPVNTTNFFPGNTNQLLRIAQLAQKPASVAAAGAAAAAAGAAPAPPSIYPIQGSYHWGGSGAAAAIDGGPPNTLRGAETDVSDGSSDDVLLSGPQDRRTTFAKLADNEIAPNGAQSSAGPSKRKRPSAKGRVSRAKKAQVS